MRSFEFRRDRVVMAWRGLITLCWAVSVACLPLVCVSRAAPGNQATNSTPDSEEAQSTLALADEQQRLSPIEEKKVDLPPPLDIFFGRRIAPTMSFTGAAWLMRDEREQEEHCEELLQNLQITNGMTVCDMGCGNGLYTMKLAKLVGPDGRVLAVDIQPEMLRMLQGQADRSLSDRIKLILGEPHDPHLPDSSLDLILCVDVYHEFSHPEHMLLAMRKALKPDGKLVLVEFREEDPTVPIKPLHKMSKQQVLKELLPHRFVLDREYDQLPWQHMMFFRPAK